MLGLRFLAISLTILVQSGQGMPGGTDMCYSYRAIQDLHCVGMNRPISEEDSQVLRTQVLTRENFQSFLRVVCSVLAVNTTCLADLVQDCPNKEEILQLSQYNGGICTSEGRIDPQVFPYIEIFTRMSLSSECRSITGVFNGCYATGNSEFPNRPPRNLTLTDGIAWWIQDRSETVRCIADLTLPTISADCGTARDFKIMEILDAVWSELYGIGAYVSIGPLMTAVAV